jgi:hypothetical protein
LKAGDLCICVKFLNPAFKTSRPAGGGANNAASSEAEPIHVVLSMV